MVTLGRETRSNFCRNLAIRHLIYGFNIHNPSHKPFVLKTFLKLTLGLTWTKDLDRVGVTNHRDDFSVVTVEMVLELPVAHIFLRTILR